MCLKEVIAASRCYLKALQQSFYKLVRNSRDLLVKCKMKLNVFSLVCLYVRIKLLPRVNYVLIIYNVVMSKHTKKQKNYYNMLCL